MTPHQKINKLLDEVLDLARENNVPVLLANIVEQDGDHTDIAMRSWVPFGAPGRMEAARDLLTLGHAVFNDVTLRGDKDNVNIH